MFSAAGYAELVTRVVDSQTTHLALLNNLSSIPTNPPSLYLNIKGINLGRHSSMSILSLYLRTENITYLVDIHQLGGAAFTTANSRGTSLKSVLESPTIPKVVFDIRNDSNALFSLYGISVKGIHDIQLMELATREGSKKYVASLAECIEKDSPITAPAKVSWRCMKTEGNQLCIPEKGGRYEKLNERPIRIEIRRYCVCDVAWLSDLYDVYNAPLTRRGGEFWHVQVERATKDRIKLSQSPEYDGQANSIDSGPWDQASIEEIRNAWDDEIMEGDTLCDDGDYTDTAKVRIVWGDQIVSGLPP